MPGNKKCHSEDGGTTASGRVSPFSRAWYTLVFLALSFWPLLHFPSKTHVGTGVKKGEPLSA